MIKYLFSIILFISIVSCYNEKIEIKRKEKLVFDVEEESKKIKIEKRDKININPNNNDGYNRILKLLQENKIVFIEENNAFIKYSPNKKYAFVASNYIEKWPDNDDEIKKECWWLIFDYEKNDIIFNDTGLILIGGIDWLEDKKYFYFNLGTDVPRALVFYNLNNLKQKPIRLSPVATRDLAPDIKDGVYFSKDLRYIVWYYWIYFEHLEPAENLKIGVKIRNIETGAEIDIRENVDDRSLEEIFNEYNDKI